MKLILENFRCHTNKTFTIPDEGITLLWGSSGCGKTSIFKSINFVLYGKEQKTTTFGAKKSKITLEFQDVTVVRTRTPNHLRVSSPTFTGEDSVAQHFINDYFGSNFLQMSYLSQKCLDNFFTQTREKRAELLRALSIQAFDIDALKLKNKEQIKERKAKLQAANNEYKFVKDEMDNRSLLETIQTPPVFPLVIPSGETEISVVDKEIKQMELNQKKLVQAQGSLKQSNETLQSLLVMSANMIAYQNQLAEAEDDSALLQHEVGVPVIIDDSKLKGLQQKCEQLELVLKRKEMLTQLQTIKEEQRVKNEQQRLLLKEQIDANAYDENEYKEIQGEIQYLEAALEAHKTIVASLASLTSLRNTSITASDHQFKTDCLNLIQSSTLNAQVQQQEEELMKLNIQLSETQQSIGLLEQQLKSHVHKCPSCSSKIAFVNNKVVEHNTDNIKSELAQLKAKHAQTQQSLSQISVSNASLKQQLKHWNAFVVLVNKYENVLEDDVASIPQDLSRARQELRDQQTAKEQLRDLETQLSNVGKTDAQSTKFLEQEIAVITKRLSSTSAYDTDSIDHIINLITETKTQIQEETQYCISLQVKQKQQQEFKRQLDTCLQKIAQLQLKIDSFDINKIDETKQVISTLNEEIKQRNEKAERFQKRKLALDKYRVDADIYKEYSRLKHKLDAALNKMSIAERALKCSLQFQQYVVDAESTAMQTFLKELNKECERHMQVMFEEDLSLKVTYESESQDTAGKETKKYYVDVTLWRNAEEVPFDSLSGGENDRCALVLFLAFNKLSRSKMLLLDECLSSLHAESIEGIVEHIKTCFSDKVCVMTLHQTTQGIFDHVISL
jgi:DNA repair exonuclease SbcCD ATPase subunit